MKITIIAALAIMLLATPSFAQNAVSTDNSNGQHQQTSATNQNVFESSSPINNTPGVGSGGGNSTAPCVVASGFGIAGPGIGLSRSNSNIDTDCVTRTEASILRDIASMHDGIEKTIVITHFCKNDVSMRETLVSIGLCGFAPTPNIQSNFVVEPEPLPYTFCGVTPHGHFVVIVSDASTGGSEACARDYAANGNVNIGTFVLK